MDNLEQAQLAERQDAMVDAICWECGETRNCYEFIVCCTGTVFHVCPACHEGVARKQIPFSDACSAMETAE